MKREGFFWIMIFLDKFIMKKFLEVCMGKGKGVVEYWVVVVKFGRVLFEVFGVILEIVKEVL